MACVHIALPDGAGGVIRGIICGVKVRKCCRCRKAADRECDWKVPGRKSGTCDRPVCSSCSMSPAPEKDLCPDHAALWEAHASNPKNRKASHAPAPPVVPAADPPADLAADAPAAAGVPAAL